MDMSSIPNWRYVAVDFDGTLVEHRFPEIGEIKQDVVDFIKLLHSRGSKIILHTCRVNGNRKYLDEAVHWCEEHGIELYGVNIGDQDIMYNKELGQLTEDVKKPYADVYIDDKALPVSTVEFIMRNYIRKEEEVSGDVAAT